MKHVIRPATLLVSLLSGIWLLSIRITEGAIWDVFGEFPSFLFGIFGIIAFAGAFLLSILLIANHWGATRRLISLPLLVNVTTLTLFAPLDQMVVQNDFQTHYAERLEIVRRVESGELWSGNPFVTFVDLPLGYSRSVSNLAGQRGIEVYRDDALNVVFCPLSGLGERTAFMYRSDGNPSLPNSHMPRAIRIEPLGDHWYRIDSGGILSNLLP